jgi:D-beta-D-heptose 7-phosphate kinase/D-beta-D-heptose 1-phosphate adenosyltransferase
VTAKIVLVTGGFDPVHSGHIAYLKAARTLGDRLIVGLNSDEWLTRKKGQAFMPWNERLSILNNLSMVDEVYTFDDDDGSARQFIQQVRAHYPNSHLIFANGGDRTKDNIPEMDVKDNNLEFIFGVGGDDKKNSSSWILQEWKNPKTPRPWGYYRILHQEGRNVKVKELVVEPGKSLSMQRHRDRSEFWFVSRGQATIYTINKSTDLELVDRLSVFENTWIHVNEWHQLTNEESTALHLIEIQFGENCEESDIERMGR